MRFDSGEDPGFDEMERGKPRFRSLKGQARQAMEELSDTLRDTFGALRFSTEAIKPVKGRRTVVPSEQEEGSEVDDSNAGSRQSDLVVDGEEGDGEDEEEEELSDAEGSIQGSEDRSRSSVEGSQAGRAERRGSKLGRRRSSHG
jgi:hypothetical protein